MSRLVAPIPAEKIFCQAREAVVLRTQMEITLRLVLISDVNGNLDVNRRRSVSLSTDQHPLHSAGETVVWSELLAVLRSR